MGFKQVFIKYYKAFAILLLNVGVFLLALNLGLLVLFKGNDYDQKPLKNPAEHHSAALSEKLYPGFGQPEVRRLLAETWHRPYVYEAYTMFKERAYSGRYVNVDKNGFRITKGQAAWPPDSGNFNVFIFGGSTAFGYGVADEHTIASCLYELLSKTSDKRVSVYNFGRGHYYSTPERILFENVLAAGIVPDMALFIDGLNEFVADKPEFINRFEQIFKQKSAAKPKENKLLLEFLLNLPMGSAARFLKSQFSGFLGDRHSRKVEKKEADYTEELYNQELNIATRKIGRYLENKRIIAAVATAYAVKPIFIWQPVPCYKYDLKYHLFAEDGLKKLNRIKNGYYLMARLVRESPAGGNFLWCADIQEQLKEPLYVDEVHYSANMSEKLAGVIYSMLLERGLLPTGVK